MFSIMSINVYVYVNQHDLLYRKQTFTLLKLTCPVRNLYKIWKIVQKPSKQYTVPDLTITRITQHFCNGNIAMTSVNMITHAHAYLEVGGGKFKMFFNTRKFYFAISSNACLKFPYIFLECS